MTPAGVDALTQRGHRVLIEQGAGEGSGIRDEEYTKHGAEMVDAGQAWGEAEMVVKVKEPLPSEYDYLREGLVLFTYLHLASSEDLTRVMLQSGVTGVAYETVETDGGRLPLLEPMSEIAGRLATQIGARCLESTWGGRGILLGGVTGVAPAEVVVIGCGSVGRNATQVAVGMGAQVLVLDVQAERLRHVQETTQGNIITVFSTPYAIRQGVRNADLIIGAVLIHGARAPRLVTEEMVMEMKPGAAIVDVAIDQGGCIETIHPTSHSEATYTKHGVVHYAVPNMPALVPRSATDALTSCTLPYMMRIADLGLETALTDDPALARGLNVRSGEITYPAVAEALPALA